MTHSSAKPKRIIVVGGGISGLAAATELLDLARQKNKAIDVTLLERGTSVGGVIRTHKQDGFLLEAGPDNFITDKPAAALLCDQIGFGDQLQNTHPHFRGAMVVRHKKLMAIPQGFLLMAPTRAWPIIKSPLFSPWGKLRMAMERFVPSKQTAGSDTAYDESLASFITRRLGKEVLNRLVQPLVGGIYTADPTQLSLAATLPRFLNMEKNHGSLTRAMKHAAKTRKQKKQSAASETAARYSLFVSPKAGMTSLVDKLVQHIGPSHIICNASVKHIAPSNMPATADAKSPGQTTWQVMLDNGQAHLADGVILACPGHRAASLLQGTDELLADQINQIQYASSAVVHMAIKKSQLARPINTFGFIVPFQENMTVLAVSFSSIKYAGRCPDDFVLMRAFIGGSLQAPLLDQDDDTLKQAAWQDVALLLGITGKPRFCTLDRWDRAMPMYHVGHVQHVKKIRQQLHQHPGLELTGNAYEGVGIPDCIAQAQRAAGRLMAFLAATATA